MFDMSEKGTGLQLNALVGMSSSIEQSSMRVGSVERYHSRRGWLACAAASSFEHKRVNERFSSWRIVGALDGAPEAADFT